MILRAPRSTPFPYTTLFRSIAEPVAEFGREGAKAVAISGPFVSTTSFSRITALNDVVLTTRSEEHTSELQSQSNLVCRLLLVKKKNRQRPTARARRCRGQRN